MDENTTPVEIDVPAGPGKLTAVAAITGAALIAGSVLLWRRYVKETAALTTETTVEK
jgi:uncharacterized iron-regulated membrane protein